MARYGLRRRTPLEPCRQDERLRNEVTTMKAELLNLLTELHERFPLDEDKILVIGCSTSEVVGKTIGKAGSIDVASDFI
ncbi:MAG: DUF436 family protein, partial [Exiguobacterium chiriqhucha]